MRVAGRAGRHLETSSREAQAPAVEPGLPGGEERRPRLYGCACNCLPLLLLVVGLGLWLGYQLGYWLASSGEGQGLLTLLAGLLVGIGVLGLVRQWRLLARRRQ